MVQLPRELPPAEGTTVAVQMDTAPRSTCTLPTLPAGAIVMFTRVLLPAYRTAGMATADTEVGTGGAATWICPTVL
jgi:hypothetical protein